MQGDGETAVVPRLRMKMAIANAIWQLDRGETTNARVEMCKAQDLLTAASAAPATQPSRTALHIVFDGPPSPDGPRFLEVETPDGKSICAGEWLERPDGYWQLVLETHPSQAAANQIGAAELEVGQAIYQRIEALMESDPRGAELDYLSDLVSSVEEYGSFDSPRKALAPSRTEEAGLREALEPFVRAAGRLDGLWDEADWRWNNSSVWGVTVADLRRLAALAHQAGEKVSDPSQGGWLPIETAPKDGTHFLAVDECGDASRCAYHREGYIMSFCGQPVLTTFEPILWMPWTPAPNTTGKAPEAAREGEA